MRRPARLLVSAILAAGLFLAGYMANGRPVPVGSSDSAKSSLTYGCPMHPQYTLDHPGDCPICGMRLEPVAGAQGTPGSTAADIPGIVRVVGASQQLIGVRTDEVQRGATTHVLRVPGRIAVDDQRLYRIIAVADGWMVSLGQNTVGRFVKKDQLLASYYTKDLLYNERLFLLSIPANEPLPNATRDFSQASIRTSGSANPQFPIDSLRGLGMSDLQIEEIHRTRTAAPQVNIYSPVSGFVLTRNVSPTQWFDKGTELYRIGDISHVWVMTDIFEKDRQFLKPGAEAAVLYQGRRLQARLSDALPQFDSESRILKTRFELDNPGTVLQPDMFVDVDLSVEMPPAITLPSDAVFDSGLRKTVFVDRGEGTFEARRVETGWRLGGRVEIVKGLMEGERVVSAANFLLDSESRMRAVSAGIFDAETDPVCGMDVDQQKARAAGRTTVHDGHTYFFCSDECKQKFEADPGGYVGPGHAHDAPAPAPGKATAPAVRMGAAPAKAPAEMAMPASEPMKTGAPATQPMKMEAAPAAQTMKMAPPSAATVKDVVCGMDIDPKAAAGKAEYQGKTYYFCSLECKQKFEKDPKQYIK